MKNKKENKIKEDNENAKSVKKSNGILIFILSITALILVINLFDTDTPIEVLDNLVSSNQEKVIFLNNQSEESSELKKILDSNLKNEGVSYIEFNINEFSEKENSYFAEKLKLDNLSETGGIKVIKGLDDLITISTTETKNKDEIMYLFAYENLLNDNQKYIGIYNYNKGKEYYDKGIMGAAYDHLVAAKNYSNSEILLSDKRFLILGETYSYKNYGDMYNLNSNNTTIYFRYTGGYTTDDLSIQYESCNGVSCLYSRLTETKKTARMINETQICTYEYNYSESSCNDFLNIEIISENQIKLIMNRNVYTLNKEY